MIALRIRGVGFWAPGVAEWSLARETITNGGPWPEGGPVRPAPSTIAANERRRAPDSVLLALAVAEQACRDAAVDPAAIASVFVSTYGDLAINHYMCGVLAEDPAQLSPTKFHNSVHNAPSGYWSIATGAMVPTTAIAASRYSFATALLEAATQIAELAAPVLVVAYDVAGAGPMAEMVDARAPFACALLLDGERGTGATLRLDLVAGNATPVGAENPGLTSLAADNPIARDAGALLEAIATDTERRLLLPVSPSLDLALQVRP